MKGIQEPEVSANQHGTEVVEGALPSGLRGYGGRGDVSCACVEEVLVSHFDVFGGGLGCRRVRPVNSKMMKVFR